ncbi:MAG: co-chaperone GroES [Rubripirellula sp.]|nr:co-chaperone GroES [Rubripirellula sp.]
MPAGLLPNCWETPRICNLLPVSAFPSGKSPTGVTGLQRAPRHYCLPPSTKMAAEVKLRVPTLTVSPLERRFGTIMGKKKAATFEHVEPIGDRVLVRKDEPKRETRGGIALPDAAEIPTITGRIVTISAVVENDEELPLRQYDKILFHPKNAIPVDLEHDNQLFVIPVDDIVAVFRRNESE